eukprot:128018-Chlamydomonas_euryale.AAC.1
MSALAGGGCGRPSFVGVCGCGCGAHTSVHSLWGRGRWWGGKSGWHAQHVPAAAGGACSRWLGQRAGRWEGLTGAVRVPAVVAAVSARLPPPPRPLFPVRTHPLAMKVPNIEEEDDDDDLDDDEEEDINRVVQDDGLRDMIRKRQHYVSSVIVQSAQLISDKIDRNGFEAGFDWCTQ